MDSSLNPSTSHVVASAKRAAKPRRENVALAAPAFSLEAVPGQMLASLTPFLPVVAPGDPAPSLIVLSMNAVPVGLGTFVGAETRGLAPSEIKGGKLETRLRFRLSAASPEQVDADMLTLQARLLGAESTLRAAGFLEFAAESSSSPAFETALSAWFRSADYRALYEYRFEASDAAQSLIARIPVHADREAVGGDRETNVVVDGMARWDELTAPRLVTRGRGLVRRIEALVFRNGAGPSGEVTLRRTFQGATAPPIEHPSLLALLAALNDASTPQRNAEVRFADLSAFLVEFLVNGTPIALGDWNTDGTLDQFQNLELTFTPGVSLPSSADRLELFYGDGEESLDHVTIAYLRMR